MLKIDPTARTIGLAAMIAIAGGFAVNIVSNKTHGPLFADTAIAETAEQAAMEPQWSASATGRVEPKTGEINLASQTPSRIIEVLANNNDNAKAGDLLVRLDDQDLYVKRAAAIQEESVRVRERDEDKDEKATGTALDRRKADDAVAAAERAAFNAQDAFDSAYRALKTGGGSAETVDKARDDLSSANAKLDQARDALAKLNANPDLPQYQRLESSLAAARAELRATEIAIERTRIRAPIDGTVLNVDANVGELAMPSPQNTLVKFGDMSSLRVRAEVEERDATKIAVGQQVVVKSDAFPDQKFAGKVTSISRSLTSPNIPTLGPRRPMDVEVVEAMIELEGTPPLFNGMRVDVFFAANAGSNASAETTKTN